MLGVNTKTLKKVDSMATKKEKLKEAYIATWEASNATWKAYYAIDKVAEFAEDAEKVYEVAVKATDVVDEMREVYKEDLNEE